MQLGRVYWQPEVWIDGKIYAHAIGMHAPSSGVGYAEFSIPHGAKYFKTVFGIARDDEHPNAYGDATGRIYVDSESIWYGDTSGSAVIEVPVLEIPEDAKVLRLEVQSKGTNWADMTTWGDPRFTAVR